ncbi:MAG: alpha/beta fold hydrolase [Chloroflexota bacterium]
MKTKLPKTVIFLWLMVTSIAIVACGRQEQEPIEVPAGAQAGDLTMEPCLLELGQASFQAECGVLVVPENRSDPRSRLIALPVLRLPASGPAAPEPIFFLAGGPGASNIMGAGAPPEWMWAKHDLVAVGYRGADGSAILDMPEVDEAMKGVGGDLLSEESLANVTEAFARGAARLQAEGVDLAGYTIPEVVADMEAARAALGYERINLFSHSYGTRIAQIYAYLYPDSLYRSVQLAVNPPGRMVQEPEMIDAQFERVAELCAQDPVCSARTDDLAETIRYVAHNMPKRWLFLPIDPGKVKVNTFLNLDTPGANATLYDAFIAAEDGDASGLALASLAYDFFLPDQIWGDSFAKAASADYDPVRNYGAELDPADSVMGSPYGLLLWSSAGAWPVAPIPAGLRQPQYTDVETLLISGSIDFLTPPQYATGELLPYLNRGRQVIMAEHGHNDVYIQNEALGHLALSFYETGVGDDSLITYHPMDFQVQVNFPTIAKIGVGVVLLLVAGLVALGWLIVRKVRRERPRTPLQ